MTELSPLDPKRMIPTVIENIGAKRAALARTNAAIRLGARRGYVLVTRGPDVWFLEKSAFADVRYGLCPSPGALRGALRFGSHGEALIVQAEFNQGLSEDDRLFAGMEVEAVPAMEGLLRHRDFLMRRLREEAAFVAKHQGDAPMWVVQEFPDSYRVLRIAENGQPLKEPEEVTRFERTGYGRSQADRYVADLVRSLGDVNEVLDG